MASGLSNGGRPSDVAAGAADEGSNTAYSESGGPKLLRHISIVTHCVPALDPVVAAWEEYLGYRAVDAGTVAADLAHVWAAPRTAGQRFCTLVPASGDPAFIRFVETGNDGPANAAITCGWNATELLVSDVDGLAQRLRNSPFTVLGGPGDLYPRPKAPRAMQTHGPAGETIYFTRLLPGGSRYGLKQARSPVDRVFIVTVGGPSSDAMEAFYGGTLGHRVMDRMPFINPLLARGCRVPLNTIFPTSIAPIPGRQFLVEIDQYPPGIGPRPRRPGHLPSGMAMVAFIVHDLGKIPVRFRAPPRAIPGPVYRGRRVAVIEGAAGEWLELIEGHA